MSTNPDGRDGGWIMDARAHIEAELARERRYVSPDFAAVVAAAHDLDPRLVSEEALREIGGLAPVIELESGVSDDRDELLAGPLLDAWIADTRALIEADVAARRLTGIPPLRAILPEPRAEPRAKLSWLGLAVALVAVVAGLAFAIPRLLETLVDANYREATSKPSQAEHLEQAGDGRADAERRPMPGPIAPPLQAVVHESDQVRDQARDQVRDQAKHDQPKHVNSTRDHIAIAELEAKAQAQWAAGELEQAQASYREIIALAGRRREADLAYGDLFTLARQRGNPAVELALWREYLDVLPNGRFADDARAGLCRRASANDRDGCWREYLVDFPKGVHTGVAARALNPAGSEVP